MSQQQSTQRESSPQVIPQNCELVNGHLVCLDSDNDLYNLFTAGEGWWGFNLTHDDALITAQAVSPATN